MQRIFQVLTTLSYGDAVGNDVLAIDAILRKHGYKTAIYAENVDARLPKSEKYHIENMPDIRKEDCILYHLSTGTKLNEWIKSIQCRRIMRYHNITPPDFFENYDSKSYELCKTGLEQTKDLKDTFDYVMADSEFNKNDLINMGYRCPIDVVPILIPFDDYKKAPDSLVVRRYRDQKTNIVFVGRIAPNKKQEDLIRVFQEYHKHYNPASRLLIVGSYNGMERYHQQLLDYRAGLGLTEEDVIFTGHIKFADILAYYSVADLFLCMSEHEGFCVPLVESMLFQVPIVAYDSCAIGGTLGGSGFLIKDKKPIEIAGVMDRILHDEKLRQTVVENQNRRVMDFEHDVIEKQIIDCIARYT